jgi:predicted nucleic acid-binding protein
LTVSFVDTNVFVYAFDSDEQVKQARAIELLQASDAGSLVTSAQVLGEFYVTVTRKLTRPLSPQQARAEAQKLAALAVVAIDRVLVDQAIGLAAQASVSYWDALIVRAAATVGAGRLFSEDLAAGQTLDGVLIVNPFA